jgi:hypothetical protein
MFTGVKAIGGLQTAIIAVMEIGVSLILAFVILGDRLSPVQAVGVGLLIWCLLLIRPKDLQELRFNTNVFLSANRLPFLQRLKPQSSEHEEPAADASASESKSPKSDAEEGLPHQTQYGD